MKYLESFNKDCDFEDFEDILQTIVDLGIGEVKFHHNKVNRYYDMVIYLGEIDAYAFPSYYGNDSNELLKKIENSYKEFDNRLKRYDKVKEIIHELEHLIPILDSYDNMYNYKIEFDDTEDVFKLSYKLN